MKLLLQMNSFSMNDLDASAFVLRKPLPGPGTYEPVEYIGKGLKKSMLHKLYKLIVRLWLARPLGKVSVSRAATHPMILVLGWQELAFRRVASQSHPHMSICMHIYTHIYSCMLE